MYNSYGTFYHNGYSELYHHGVKGQKWGERRWQNPDGSLTPEGYEHYGRKQRKLETKIEKNKDAADFTRRGGNASLQAAKVVAPIYGGYAAGQTAIALKKYYDAYKKYYGITPTVNVPAIITTVLSSGAMGAGAVLLGGAATYAGSKLVGRLLENKNSRLNRDLNEVKTKTTK
jgi:hypothetical protein